ncbi:kinesin-like protein KIF9 [Eublepharis macularius]|uniref:Kinesin-like protein n=1 Tax=Eublepharis macularius TaxID=481883 RepID=A0AA97L9Z1_EUBMA|nr:kinesin-like protein KIF9 [Eublepharis macularius]
MCASIKRVHAFARLKPSADFSQDMIKFGPDNLTINIYIERDHSKGVVNNKQTDWSFKLDGVFHNATQELVYDSVARDLVSQALNGYNGTIICYGQTGAGKTFTMTGTTGNYEHRGIIPRAIQQVFKSMEDHASQFMTIRVSYLEIHNEIIFDLLSSTPHVAYPPLSIAEGPQGVSVKSLTVHTCPSEEVALNFLFEGDMNRTVGHHALNSHSSRSHCIFTIYIECHSRIMSDATFVTSKINLVDLAGSERLAKSKSEGRGLKETTYINKSLSFLEQVIIALSERNREHVPFRQSKLTYTLKDSLGGNCNTVLVANICSEPVHIVETLSTLRFATRMKWVTTAPVVNEKFDTERLVKNLEREVLYLKEELAVHNSLLNRPPVTYEPLNEIQVAEINSQVRRFLEGTIDEFDIVSLRQIHEIFNQFKVILSQQEQEVEARLRSKYTLIDKSDFATLAAVQKAGLVDADGHLVGEVDGQGFGIGVAPFSAKSGGKRAKMKKGKEQPSSAPRKEGLASTISGKELDSISISRSQVVSKEQEAKEAQDVLSVETCRTESGPKDDAAAQPSCPPTRIAAFEDFKSERGSEINRIFKENKAILIDRKRKMSEAAQRISVLKQEMDAAKQALECQRLDREQQGEYLNEEGQIIIDEDEFLLLVKMKELRKQYRADFGSFRDLQSEVQYCQHLVDQCRQKLLTEFEIWYNESFLIPEEVQEALKPGGAIRPGMIPINRVLTLDEDEQERFDRMQEEVLPFCPDSVSFYNAKAKTDRKHKYSQAMTTLEQMRKKPAGIQSVVKNKPPSGLDAT